MQNKLFLKAADVCELLEVSTTSAYEIIANLNSELEKKGRTEPETGTSVGTECIAEHGRKGNCDGRGRRAGRT